MKLIALLGQTSSGKSDMAVDLAKDLDGEVWIVGADSRQVYKNLNLATGKIEGEYNSEKQYFFGGFRHFLIDFVDLEKNYTLLDFAKDFYNLFQKPCSELPNWVILVGGTGLYIRAITQKYDLFETKPEFEESHSSQKNFLEKLNLLELQNLAKTENINLNSSDFNNSHRLVNSLLNQQSLQKNWVNPIPKVTFEVIHKFAIQIPNSNLKDKIHQRLLDRIENGMLEEIDVAYKKYGEKRVLDLGLECRLSLLYLLGQINYTEFLQKTVVEINRYAKRQLTWLKKEPNLIWIGSKQEILEKIK